jgi:hypothetical protein
MTQFAISLGVFRINRSCKPANPAFTMSEILRRARPRKVRERCASKLFVFVVFNVAKFGLLGIAAKAGPTSPFGLRRTVFSALRRRLVEPIGIEPTT